MTFTHSFLLELKYYYSYIKNYPNYIFVTLSVIVSSVIIKLSLRIYYSEWTNAEFENLEFETPVKI